MSEARAALPGSLLPQTSGRRIIAPADPNQTLNVSVVLRRRSDSSEQAQSLLSGQAPAASRAQIEQELSAEPADIDTVTSFAEEHGLAVTSVSPPSRTIHLSGTVSQLEDAFGVHLQQMANASGAHFIGYDGTITIPATLSGVVTAVLGLHTEPIAKPR